MKITLTEREFKFVEMLGRGRHYLKDVVIPDRKLDHWNNSQHEADVLGVMGEYAVAKYLKIPMDTEINLQGDGGEIDLWLGDWSIQVKATKYKSGRLVFNTKEEMASLIDILTICDIKKRTVDIVGYISHKDLQKQMYEKDLGHGKRYCVDQDKLTDVAWLAYYNTEWINKKQ